MATAQERFDAAAAYVQRAAKAVDGWTLSIADAYANRLKVEPVENELSRIRARWLRATSDAERLAIARDAELLADRTEENLPGAPQTWKRTNLARGEVQRATPATSYLKEAGNEALRDMQSVVDKMKYVGEELASKADSLVKLALFGGAIYLGVHVVDAIDAAGERRARRRGYA